MLTHLITQTSLAVYFVIFRDKDLAGCWWLKSLIPALGRQRQTDLCEFEASLVYRMNSETAKAIL